MEGKRSVPTRVTAFGGAIISIITIADGGRACDLLGHTSSHHISFRGPRLSNAAQLVRFAVA